MTENLRSRRANRIKEAVSDRILYIITVIIMLAAFIVTLYPFLYVLSMSLSDQGAVLRQEVWLFPKGLNLHSYEKVFADPAIWTAYGNTLFYTIAGTILNVFMTCMMAYPLSRKQFWGRNTISMLVVFTMLFSGGMIPNFLLIKNLGLYNTRWALILPGAISAYNLFLARTYFSGLPDSLVESASIDGATEATILRKIIVPLSMPIIAVLTLFYAVGHWNSYFNALLYIPDIKKQPLQMFLVKLLVLEQDLMAEGGADALELTLQAMQTKYATIIVVILPILCVYPFLQKYFTQGVMIGAIKE
ncbi:MAG: carbohydrate ABC transporter permease [Candidatus Merdivicinus sp.]|jgi:putative aldouronate transport system permease protein